MRGPRGCLEGGASYPNLGSHCDPGNLRQESETHSDGAGTWLDVLFVGFFRFISKKR
jgi:hypothetical protein